MAWQEGMPGVQATLFTYCPPTTPVQFSILAVPCPGGVEYTPGVLVEGRSQETDWFLIVSCEQDGLVNHTLRPFPRVGHPEIPCQQFSSLELARAFVDEVARPRWFLELSGLQLQAAVEAVAGILGVAPDIWIEEPLLQLNGSRPSLQVGEAGATFTLAGLQRVVGVTEGMGVLEIALPEEYYEKQSAWFEPGSGFWSYVELRYPQGAVR
ncbi:MAG: hypothetical protein ACREDR_00985 [Blastocatellia bacterium]